MTSTANDQVRLEQIRIYGYDRSRCSLCGMKIELHEDECRVETREEYATEHPRRIGAIPLRMHPECVDGRFQS